MVRQERGFGIGREQGGLTRAEYQKKERDDAEVVRELIKQGLHALTNKELDPETKIRYTLIPGQRENLTLLGPAGGPKGDRIRVQTEFQAGIQALGPSFTMIRSTNFSGRVQMGESRYLTGEEGKQAIEDLKAPAESPSR